MISCKKILIVALAALILGGGMVSMSMHAMQQQRGRHNLWQKWAPTVKSVGKKAARLVGVPLLVTLAVSAVSKAWFCGKNSHLFINVTPESARQAAAHFEDVAHQLSVGAFLGTLAYYIEKELS